MVQLHRALTSATEGPNKTGLFSGGVPSVRPIVIDANVLRNEAGYACKNSVTTTFLNAAGKSYVRPFAAAHVIDEVVRHIDEWATDLKLSRLDYRNTLNRYRAVLRVVDVPESWLLPSELNRLNDQCRVIDPDDTPTATLAMIMNAPLISEDAGPCKTVYGAGYDMKLQRDWLQLFKAAGDIGLIETHLKIGSTLGILPIALANAASDRLFPRNKQLSRASSALVLLSPLAIALISESKRKKFCNFLATTLDAASPFFDIYHHSDHVLADRCPIALSRTEGATSDMSADALLGRACIRVLAAWPGAHMSADQLAKQLPPLPVAQGTANIRTLLNTYEATFFGYRGRWQVGRSLPRSWPAS